MHALATRRRFLQAASASALALSALPLRAAEQPQAGEVPPITVISGKPRERGRAYGSKFKDAIRGFHDREIAAAFIGKPSSKEELFRYAAACGKVIREVCPEIHDELEGLAEGADLKLEEAILTTLHEELYHRSPLPQQGHCTAVAVGPPTR